MEKRNQCWQTLQDDKGKKQTDSKHGVREKVHQEGSFLCTQSTRNLCLTACMVAHALSGVIPENRVRYNPTNLGKK